MLAGKKSMLPLFLVSQLWLYLGKSQVSVYRTIGPLVLSFVLELTYVNTRPSTHQKAFIVDHSLPCSIGFDSSTTLGIMVHAHRVGQGVKI